MFLIYVEQEGFEIASYHVSIDVKESMTAVVDECVDLKEHRDNKIL